MTAPVLEHKRASGSEHFLARKGGRKKLADLKSNAGNVLHISLTRPCTFGLGLESVCFSRGHTYDVQLKSCEAQLSHDGNGSSRH